MRRHRAVSTSSSSSHSTTQDRHVLDILAERSLLQSVTSRAIRNHLGKGRQSEQEAAQNAVQPFTRRTIYAGVDPSANSLHVGNLLPLMALLWLAKHGHRVIVVVSGQNRRDSQAYSQSSLLSFDSSDLFFDSSPFPLLLYFVFFIISSRSQIGGATGSIGDPSGRSTERSSLSPQQLDHNVKSITKQVLDFFKSASEHESRRNGGKQIEYDINVINNQHWYEGMNVLTFLSQVGRHARVGVMMARDR